jgi:hypothetical protein
MRSGFETDPASAVVELGGEEVVKAGEVRVLGAPAKVVMPTFSFDAPLQAMVKHRLNSNNIANSFFIVITLSGISRIILSS